MPSERVLSRGRKASVPVRRSSSFNTDISPLCQVISRSSELQHGDLDRQKVKPERKVPKRAKSFNFSDLVADELGPPDSPAYASIRQLFYQQSGKSSDSLASTADKATALRVLETAKKFRQRSKSSIDSPTRERLKLAAKELQSQRRHSIRKSLKQDKRHYGSEVDENNNEVTQVARPGRLSLQEPNLPPKRGFHSAPVSPAAALDPAISPKRSFNFNGETSERCDEQIAQWYRRNSTKKSESLKKDRVKSKKKPAKEVEDDNSPFRFLICSQKDDESSISEHLSLLDKCSCDCCTQVAVPWSKRQKTTLNRDSSKLISGLAMPSLAIYFDRMGVRRQVRVERKRGVVVSETPSSAPDNYEGGFLPPSNSLCLKTLKHLLYLRCRLSEPFKKAPMSCDGYYGCDGEHCKASRKKSKF